MFSLDEKVAVITGAASGLGKATALRFARAGAKVVLGDVNDASEVAGEAGGIYVRTDVSSEEQVQRLMQVAVSEYGKLTTVVNNAGIGGQMGTLDSITREGIDEALNINFKGVLWGI